MQEHVPNHDNNNNKNIAAQPMYIIRYIYPQCTVKFLVYTITYILATDPTLMNC